MAKVSISVRVKDTERAALNQEAAAKDTTVQEITYRRIFRPDPLVLDTKRKEALVMAVLALEEQNHRAAKHFLGFVREAFLRRASDHPPRDGSLIGRTLAAIEAQLEEEEGSDKFNTQGA